MRKILFAGVVLLVVFVTVFRERLFLRDPLGKVERNGTAQDAARVYINYTNDVLVQDAATHGFVLVQGWNKVPGVPQHLSCLNGLACWTDADRAAILPLGGQARRAPAEMSARQVSFTDSTGDGVRVVLR